MKFCFKYYDSYFFTFLGNHANVARKNINPKEMVKSKKQNSLLKKISDITTKFKEVLVRLCRSKKDLIKPEIEIFKQVKTEISKVQKKQIEKCYKSYEGSS